MQQQVVGHHSCCYVQRVKVHNQILGPTYVELDVNCDTKHVPSISSITKAISEVLVSLETGKVTRLTKTSGYFKYLGDGETIDNRVYGETNNRPADCTREMTSRTLRFQSMILQRAGFCNMH